KPVYGARGMGMGGATAATGFDPTATLVNPALLIQIEGLTADVGTMAFYHPGNISFTRQADELSPGGYPEQDTSNELSTVPYAGVIYHPEDARWAFGVGINVPFAE